MACLFRTSGEINVGWSNDPIQRVQVPSGKCVCSKSSTGVTRRFEGVMTSVRRGRFDLCGYDAALFPSALMAFEGDRHECRYAVGGSNNQVAGWIKLVREFGEEYSRFKGARFECDDPRPAGGQSRRSCEEITASNVHDEVQGYAAAPVVLFALLECSEKGVRRGWKREDVAHVQCRKGHALFFLTRKIDR